MYAIGATPETVRPPEARVAAFPAAIPATCVPCPEAAGSNGTRAYGIDESGGGNARATITLAVAYWRWPFGNPAGIEYPAGAEQGGLWSTPVSIIPIFVPRPAVARP